MRLVHVLFTVATICGAQVLHADENNCLDGQDLNSEDIDISQCPALPNEPQTALLGTSNTAIDLGAWEIGTTATGENYKYGSLSNADTNPRILNYGDGTVAVNDGNISCWAKGYYRLRKILQNPPAEYVKLRNAGFQVRFFQFQTDLRNGPTGYRQISSYRDHLVKWVTVIDENGICVQPTLEKFTAYAKSELARRGIQ